MRLAAGIVDPRLPHIPELNYFREWIASGNAVNLLSFGK